MSYTREQVQHLGAGNVYGRERVLSKSFGSPKTFAVSWTRIQFSYSLRVNRDLGPYYLRLEHI